MNTPPLRLYRHLRYWCPMDRGQCISSSCMCHKVEAPHFLEPSSFHPSVRNPLIHHFGFTMFINHRLILLLRPCPPGSILRTIPPHHQAGSILPLNSTFGVLGSTCWILVMLILLLPWKYYGADAERRYPYLQPSLRVLALISFLAVLITVSSTRHPHLRTNPRRTKLFWSLEMMDLPCHSTHPKGLLHIHGLKHLIPLLSQSPSPLPHPKKRFESSFPPPHWLCMLMLILTQTVKCLWGLFLLDTRLRSSGMAFHQHQVFGLLTARLNAHTASYPFTWKNKMKALDGPRCSLMWGQV